MNANEEIEVDLMLRDAGSMKATADATIQTALGTLTISDFKVIEKEPGKPWISEPSNWYEAGGQRRYKKIIQFSKPGMKTLAQAILKEYEKKRGA